MGIWLGRDLKKLERLEFVRLFGKAGNYYYDICRGEDHRPVQPSRERKSVGAEQTFSTDLFYENDLEREMLEIADILWERITRSAVKAKTLTLKYKYADFEQHTRSFTISTYFSSREQLVAESRNLLKSGGGFSKGIRLLGLTVSNFVMEEIRKPVQLTIEF
jgi:DNA polymerase-4